MAAMWFILLFVAIGVVLGTKGITVSTWQYWVTMGLVLIVELSAYVRGKLKD